MKNFTDYSDLAASLIVDLKKQTGAFIYSRIEYNIHYYQSAKKLTTDEQDEQGLESEILLITAESFDKPRVVNKYLEIEGDDSGAFSITQEEYDDYLNQLISEFNNLKIDKEGGLLRFN